MVWGNLGFLNQHQEWEVTEEVGSGRFRTGGEIMEWVESEYGVSLRLGGVYSLLARLGWSPGFLKDLMRRLMSERRSPSTGDSARRSEVWE